MRALPIRIVFAFIGVALFSSCGDTEDKRLAELQSHCSSLDANYNEENIKGCTAFLSEPSLAAPVRAMTYNIRGNTYDALKKHDLAIADYKETIRLLPEFAPAYANVGLQYLRLGDFKTAAEYYDQAIKVNPQSGYAMYGRGVALSRLGQVEAAKEQLALAIQADPDIAEVYVEIKMEPFGQ
jgi:lipoprotein NlpI